MALNFEETFQITKALYNFCAVASFY